MKNDIKVIENKFVTNMGNGTVAGAHLQALVADMISSGDSRHMASAIARLNVKGDKQGSNAVREIVGGAKMKRANDKKTIVIAIKDAKTDDAAMARLTQAVEDKLSIRSTMVKRVKGDTEKDAFVLPDFAAKLVKRMEKQNISKAALIAAIQAA